MSFGSFELAANDRLWVEATDIYGLLELFYDPVAWVGSRRKSGGPWKLESPFTLTLERHAGDTVPPDQVLVQGIDRTPAITLRLGSNAGARLFEHMHTAQNFEAFEESVLSGHQAGGGEAMDTGRLRSSVIPAIYGVLNQRVGGKTVDSAAQLYERFKASHAGKELDGTVVRSNGGIGDLLYVHFGIWPDERAGDISKLTEAQMLANKQSEVALFQFCAATDPAFLPSVLESGHLVRPVPTFGWDASGAFKPEPPEDLPEKLVFHPSKRLVRFMQIGKAPPIGAGGGSKSGPGASGDPTAEAACEILVAVQQPDGSYVYEEAIGKPYE